MSCITSESSPSGTCGSATGAKVLHEFDCVGEALALAEVEAAVYRPSEVLVQDDDGHVEVVSRYAAFE